MRQPTTGPSIYEYVYQGTPDPLVDLYAPLDALHASTLTFVAVVVGALLIVVARYREDRQLSLGALVPLSRLWPWLVLVAVYCLTWSNVDEVSINLEHPFNLYHFGKFSFSPTRMVDGTVEYVYYLLLTPFAATAATLVVANFVLGLLIACGHLWILSQLLTEARASTRLGLLALFSVNYPMIAMLSSGFGNGLVSLGLLAALQLHLSGRLTAARIVGGMLPLLRPDAILYSYALLFATHAAERRDWRPAMKWLWPVSALAIYLLAFHWSYGHWIPTPIAFKSVHPSMISATAIKPMMITLLGGVTHPTHLLGAIAVFGAAVFRADPSVRVIRRLLVPSALILGFYAFSRGVLGDLSGDSYGRYWVGFELALFLCLFFTLARLATALDAGGRVFEATLVFGRLVPLLVVLIVARGIIWQGARPNLNRSYLGFAGQLASRLVPAGLSISASELNTFGLLIADREVIDLYGYTNPAIAQARLLNRILRIRSNPALFLSIKPDVYYGYLPLDDLSKAEVFLGAVHTSYLGDMNRVLEEYDVFQIRHPLHDFMFFVRRPVVPELRQSLDAHSFKMTGARPIDMDQFRAIYARQRPLEVSF